jgi:hypothetical protein
MQNKFSRDFVEQKDKDTEANKKEWRLRMMNPPPPPPSVIIPEISGEKYGCEYPNTEWLVIKVFIIAAVVSVTILIVSKIFL